MGLEATHPLFDKFKSAWVTMRDLFQGEATVKAKGATYLPPTEGMVLDGYGKGTEKPGQLAYDAYKMRAVFPDFVKEGVKALVGMMHKKPPVIELPTVMEPLREKCTLTGEGLADLLRFVNTEQLLTGRIGLMADLPAKVDAAAAATTLPYITAYIAETIRNWDEARAEQGFSSLNMVILDESTYVRDTDFTWKHQVRYRLLQLGDLLANEVSGEYSTGVFDQGTAFSAGGMNAPVLQGKKLDQIPFVFANTTDIVSSPDDPPLSGLGALCLAIYRGEADYRQNLHQQGQDTFVVIGGVRNPDGVPGVDDDAMRIGAGSRVEIETGGDAKMVGVSGKGLTEQREALENDREAAESKAGKLIPNKASDAESGEALKTRISAQTATLTEIALAGGKALQNILRIIAVWRGADPEKVKVSPNLEFAELTFNAEELVKLMTSRSMGAPISLESIHNVMKDRGLTKMAFEDELEKIQDENAQMPPPPGSAGAPPEEEPEEPGEDE